MGHRCRATAGKVASHSEKGSDRMDQPRLVQLECKVEQLRKIEPVIKDLCRELFVQDPKDEAEAVLVALARVRAALAAGEERLNAAR